MKRFFMVRHPVAKESGMAVITMSMIVAAMVGSYHFYNKGVRQTSSEIYGRAGANFTIGDVFARNVINRVVNIMKDGLDAECYDGGRSTLSEVNEFTHKFLEKRKIKKLIEATDKDAVETDTNLRCLASSEDLKNIQKFSLTLEAQVHDHCFNVIKIKAKGKTKLPFDDGIETSFEEFVDVTVSFFRGKDLGLVFEGFTKSEPAIKLKGKKSSITFETPVFIVTDDDGPLHMDAFIAGFSDSRANKNITFEKGVATNASHIVYSDDPDWNYGRLQGIFPHGISIKHGIEKDQVMESFRNINPTDSKGYDGCGGSGNPLVREWCFFGENHDVIALDEEVENKDKYTVYMSGFIKGLEITTDKKFKYTIKSTQGKEHLPYFNRGVKEGMRKLEKFYKTTIGTIVTQGDCREKIEDAQQNRRDTRVGYKPDAKYYIR